MPHTSQALPFWIENIPLSLASRTWEPSSAVRAMSPYILQPNSLRAPAKLNNPVNEQVSRHSCSRLF